MEYTVDIMLRTARPLTEGALTAIAAIGGAAAGIPGDRDLETRLTVEADSAAQAVERGVARITGAVRGTLLAVEAMTTAEADRRANEPAQELVGVTEIAGMLGLTKQRISALSRRDDFPRPIATLASGPVWRAGDLSTFAAGWRRRPGRPKKSIDSVHRV